MPNPQHLQKLSEGTNAWNQWREDNPGVVPNLRGANLKNANLQGANLSGADIRSTNFSGAQLQNANLREVQAGLQQEWLRVKWILLLVMSFLTGMLAAFTYSRLLAWWIVFSVYSFEKQIIMILPSIILITATKVAILKQGFTPKSISTVAGAVAVSGIVTVVGVGVFDITKTAASRIFDIAEAVAGAGIVAAAGTVTIADASVVSGTVAVTVTGAVTFIVAGIFAIAVPGITHIEGYPMGVAKILARAGAVTTVLLSIYVA